VKFISRTGHRPLTKKRETSNAPAVTATAEFGAMLRIMQEANLDLLGQFYGGARLTYDQSVAQKVIYMGHEGKLHGLSSRLKKFQKTTKHKFVNETRVGRYLKGVGAVEA
jgi:hypothetical protein